VYLVSLSVATGNASFFRPHYASELGKCPFARRLTETLLIDVFHLVLNRAMHPNHLCYPTLTKRESRSLLRAVMFSPWMPYISLFFLSSPPLKPHSPLGMSEPQPELELDELLEDPNVSMSLVVDVTAAASTASTSHLSSTPEAIPLLICAPFFLHMSRRLHR